MSDLVEKLASLEHEQWVTWANSILMTEDISPERSARWRGLFVPYAELSEEMKEHDRVWARKVLLAVRDWDADVEDRLDG